MKVTKVKKAILIFVVIIFTILYTNKTFAKTTVKVNSTAKTEENSITISVEIADLQEIGEGINAYIMTLNYNPKQLEFESVVGKNDWNKPSYNKENIADGKIKFVATRSDFSRKNEIIMQMKLKIKDGVSEKNIDKITINDISFAYKQGQETNKVVANDIQVKLEDTISTNSSSSSKKYNETNQKEKLPKTLPKAGITNNILLIMGILITTCLIFIKYKSIKLK